MRVLIADDHLVVRLGLRQLLTEEFPGVECQEAGTSQGALDMILAQPWDVVLLDISMPGRSGLDVLAELQRMKVPTPVLILSTYPEAEFAVRALKAGARGYLTKQGASDELVEAIRVVMAGGIHVSDALAQALARMAGDPGNGAAHDQLSPRELEVMRLVAGGRSVKEIASELSLSEKTVGTYRSRLMEKLGVRSSVDIARYAIQHRLVD